MNFGKLRQSTLTLNALRPRLSSFARKKPPCNYAYPLVVHYLTCKQASSRRGATTICLVIKPTPEHEVGFRLAEFNPEQGRFRISRPYDLVFVPERGALTIRQP